MFMTGLKKMNNYPEVIAIVGPTASGKTALSVNLAKAIGGEVINGDAMQVYKGLDIGTAKITAEEMDGIPHHLFDVKEPDEPFSVAEYQMEVRKWIKDIQDRGKTPIITGGTGLYVQSVLFDFRFTEEAADLEVRNRLEIELAEKGAEFLYRKLVELDPAGAETIHPNNHRRIVRALEIIEVTGKTKSDHEEGVGHASLYDHNIIGLEMDRDVLYERINRRVDLMMEKGLLEEAEKLWHEGIRGVQSVQAIGYRELHQFIEKKLSLDEAVDLIKKNTRNYAKRQMTYFRNKLDVSWFDAKTGTNETVKGILEILKDFEHPGRIK
jgi:tRNA dimethylallyltransferase